MSGRERERERVTERERERERESKHALLVNCLNAGTRLSRKVGLG